MYFRKVFSWTLTCLLTLSAISAAAQQPATTNQPSAGGDQKIRKRALEIHRKAIVVDTAQ